VSIVATNYQTFISKPLYDLTIVVWTWCDVGVVLFGVVWYDVGVVVFVVVVVLTGMGMFMFPMTVFAALAFIEFVISPDLFFHLRHPSFIRIMTT
jgi:hypothetical protein